MAEVKEDQDFTPAAFTLEKRRLRKDPINVYSVSKKDGARLFLVVLSNRTKGNGEKVMHKTLYLSTRKNFFTVWVTEHWDSLLREVVESPSLEILKKLSGHSSG